MFFYLYIYAYLNYCFRSVCMKMFVPKVLANSKVICLFFLLLGGLLSCFLQYQIQWDFTHYHYYNAWAFVNGRFNQDVLMAGVNAYFNPLPDVPLYFMIKYLNDIPLLICFLQGLWFGALLYMIYRLERLYFDFSTAKGKFYALICFLIAMTGNATFLQIGASSNEIMLAFFYLLALYLLVHEIFFLKSGKKSAFIWSGFLLGMAMALKLTGVIYCVVSGASLILFYKKIKNPWQNIAWFVLFGFLGFLTFSGFWIWKLWTEFQNPFYPFANSIFKSEWMSFSNFSDQNFNPQNWRELFIWPIITSLSLRREEGNGMFVPDFRSLFVYLIFLSFILKTLFYFLTRRQKCLDEKWFFLGVYTFICYIIWAYFFSISRYFVLGEILFAFFIVKVLFSKNPTSVLGRGVYYAFLIVSFFILCSTPYFSDKWGVRDDWRLFNQPRDMYVWVEDVNIPDNALIKTYNYPTSAVFTYFAEKKPSIKGVNVFQQMYGLKKDTILKTDYFDINPHWKKLREEVVSSHKGPKLLLVAHGYEGKKLNMDVVKSKEVKGMRCHYLRNNMLPLISLCAPKEIADDVFKNNNLKIFEDNEDEK